MLHTSMCFDKCILTCTHHYGITENSFTAPKFPVLQLFFSSFLLLSPWQTLIFSQSPPFHLFPKSNVVGIIPFVGFSDWLLPLNKMHFKFFHVFSWHDSSFIFMAEWYSGVQIYHRLLIHLLKSILVASRFWLLYIRLL